MALSPAHPDSPEEYISHEEEDLTALSNHLQEIADGYLERGYEDIVYESLMQTINTINHVLKRMELGD